MDNNLSFLENDLSLIYRLDEEVYNRLIKDSELIDFYERVTKIKKILLDKKKDKPVNSLSQPKEKDMQPYSCGELFYRLYNTIEVEKDKSFYIKFLTRNIEVDEDSLKIMKALVRMNISKNKDISKSCSDLFMKILSLATKTNINIINLATRLEVEGYYETEIFKVIMKIYDQRYNLQG